MESLIIGLTSHSYLFKTWVVNWRFSFDRPWRLLFDRCEVENIFCFIINFVCFAASYLTYCWVSVFKIRFEISNLKFLRGIWAIWNFKNLVFWQLFDWDHWVAVCSIKIDMKFVACHTSVSAKIPANIVARTSSGFATQTLQGCFPSNEKQVGAHIGCHLVFLVFHADGVSLSKTTRRFRNALSKKAKNAYLVD